MQTVQLCPGDNIDCSGIVDSEYSVAECGGRIFEALLLVASDEQTAGEALGYGDNEFKPRQTGVTY